MSLWNGVFYKHRDYCGDIANHIVVKSVTLLDDDEAMRYVEHVDDDEGPDEPIVEIGFGSLKFLINFGFVGSDEQAYEIIVAGNDNDYVDEEARKEAMHVIISNYFIEQAREKRKKKDGVQ